MITLDNDVETGYNKVRRGRERSPRMTARRIEDILYRAISKVAEQIDPQVCLGSWVLKHDGDSVIGQ